MDFGPQLGGFWTPTWVLRRLQGPFEQLGGPFQRLQSPFEQLRGPFQRLQGPFERLLDFNLMVVGPQFDRFWTPTWVLGPNMPPQSRTTSTPERAKRAEVRSAIHVFTWIQMHENVSTCI